MLAEQRSADNNPIPDRAERLIYWIPRSRLSEDFAQFCLSGSLTVPLATLSAGRQASHFFLYCTYFYFNRIFWLVSNSLARTSLSGFSVCVSMSVCSQPRVRLATAQRRRFAVVGPCFWNALFSRLRSELLALSLPLFRSRLKTILFDHGLVLLGRECL